MIIEKLILENFRNYQKSEFMFSSGINILTRNLAHKSSGTTSERPTAPNLNQPYFDTTLNKMICFKKG